MACQLDRPEWTTLTNRCMYLRVEASEKHLHWVAELALLAQLY